MSRALLFSREHRNHGRNVFLRSLDSGPEHQSISDRCVPRRANLTVATKADRAGYRAQGDSEVAKRAKRRGRGVRKKEGKDCIKSHPLLAPLPLCIASCDVYRAHKRDRPDLRPTRTRKNTVRTGSSLWRDFCGPPFDGGERKRALHKGNVEYTVESREGGSRSKLFGPFDWLLCVSLR